MWRPTACYSSSCWNVFTSLCFLPVTERLLRWVDSWFLLLRRRPRCYMNDTKISGRKWMRCFSFGLLFSSFFIFCSFLFGFLFSCRIARNVFFSFFFFHRLFVVAVLFVSAAFPLLFFFFKFSLSRWRRTENSVRLYREFSCRVIFGFLSCHTALGSGVSISYWILYPEVLKKKRPFYIFFF